MTDFINPAAAITGVRSVCVHGVSPLIQGDDKVFAETYANMSVAELVTFTSTFLAQDGGRHFLAFVFNENGDQPFAVVNDMDGQIKVVWDFKGENDFSAGNLEFEHKLTSVEWAADALSMLTGNDVSLVDMFRSVFGGPNITVIGLDENGPFNL